MHREHNYHRVYWAGAAIALRVDVDLLRASGGKQSLDDVMRLLHRALRRPRSQAARGVDLLRAADRALGHAAQRRRSPSTASRRRPDFPDVESRSTARWACAS